MVGFISIMKDTSETSILWVVYEMENMVSYKTTEPIVWLRWVLVLSVGFPM